MASSSMRVGEPPWEGPRPSVVKGMTMMGRLAQSPSVAMRTRLPPPRGYPPRGSSRPPGEVSGLARIRLHIYASAWMGPRWGVRSLSSVLW